MLVKLALFGLAFSNCMLDAIKRAIGDIDGSFVLLSYFLVYYVPVLFEGKSLVIVHSDLYLLLGRH